MQQVLAKRTPLILDASGNEIVPSEAVQKQAVAKAWNSYVTALAGVDAKPGLRAREPFKNHVWVYAAVMAIAVNAGQVQYRVYKEDPDDPATGRGKEPQKDRLSRRRGRRRTAGRKYLEQQGRKRGMKIRGLVPDYDHEFSELAYRPNPMMSQSYLIQLTSIYMSMRGCCFWIKTDENGMLIAPGERPSQLWPIDPNWMTPVTSQGKFLGWELNMPYDRNLPNLPKTSIVAVEQHQVCWFRYPDPNDSLGWLSPIAAAAQGITLDMMAMTFDRAVLANGSKPGGILMHEDDIDEEEEKKLKTQWKQRYEGPQNANRLAILTGSFKYIDIGLGPKEIAYLEQRNWNRDEIFAVLRVTKSVMGLSEGLNYATQLSQDKNFWDKCLMPLMRMYEDVLDFDLFQTEPDDIVGAFDFSKVEALRVGLSDLIEQAVQLSGPILHVPPELSFEIVGLEVPAYPASDVAFVPPTQVPAEMAAEGPPDPETEPGPGQDEDDQPKPKPDDQQPRPSVDAKAYTRRKLRDKLAGLWVSTVQAPAENRYRPVYRAWVVGERKATLAIFDETTGFKRRAWDRSSIDAVIPGLAEMMNRLKSKVRPLAVDNLEQAYKFEESILGSIGASIDDPKIQAFIESKANRLASAVPARIRGNLEASLAEGMKAQETLEQLRARVEAVYDVAESTSSVRHVSRTETASFLNGAKFVLYQLSNVGKADWVDSKDERVRAHHVSFGEAEPKPLGFNYMTVVGGSGTLRYPGDVEGPIDEIANCRCTLLAAI